MWEIKGKDNVVKAIPSTKPEYNGVWMEQCYVTVNVESPTPIDFEIGDYIIYRNERFEINYDPGKIKCAPPYAKGDAFKYENIKFNSLADELTRCDFLDVVLNDNQLHFTGLPKFRFYGNVQDLANRMQANLDKTYGKGTWSVVVSPEYTDRTEINVAVDSPMKVQGALSFIVNDFKTYYTIKGRTLTIGTAGIPAGYLFKYGKGNGLYEIEQNAEADQAIVTRLRAYGSTRNLPHRYYNSLTGADGNKLIPDNMAVQNLMLPSFPYTTQDPYIDSPNIGRLGIRENTIFFDGSQEGLDEIYPSIEGMTAEDLHKAGVQCNATGALDEIVSAEQMTDNGVGEINEAETETKANPPTFKVMLKDLGFDINDHLTTETATLSFITGKLGGRDFEIVDCKKEGNNYILELNRVYDDGIKLWFPYKDYNAAAGDKIKILHIAMPEVYIKAAAVRLKEAAEKWLSKNDYSRSIYAPKIDEIFMARQHDEAMASGGTIKSLHDTIKEGMLLLFEDDDLNIDASIFIDQLTIKEEGKIPTYEVVLKEEKTVGRLDKMQNQIDSLAAGKGQGSGYTASQIRSMIEAYGGSVFLSKLKDDRSAGKIASDIAVEVGDFISGNSGASLHKRPDGSTELEVDRLWVRVKALFEELTTVRTEAMAGEFIVTPAGGLKCTSVSDLGDSWRCYFAADIDGEKIKNTFKAGDQARCSFFNAAPGTSNKISNKFYWRLVTAVGNDYIELSKQDCADNSDEPEAGDEIVQLGNRNEADRQTAIRISTVLGNAPSISLLRGVNSYTLENCEQVSFGVDATSGRPYLNCYGDFHFGSKDKRASYLVYNSDSGEMDYRGRLNLQSTVGTGDRTLGDVVSDAEAAGYSLQADNQVAGVACDAEGNPTGALPRCQLSVWRGTEKVTDGVSYSVEDAEGVTASASFDRGLVTFSSMTAETATAVVRAEVAGVSLSVTLSLYKVLPGADGSDAVVYSLLTSVGNVLRGADGSAAPSEVSCAKYRTDGTGTAKTGEMWLYSRRYSGETPSAWSLLAGPGEESGTVAVADGVTAVEFELRDGEGARPSVLDRETVRVLTDASGLLIGGTNLLAGTNRGTDGWIANTSSDGEVALAEKVIEGTRGLQVASLSSVASPQYRLLMREIPSDLFKSGKRYTLSFDAWCSAEGVAFSVDAGLSTGDDPLVDGTPWHYFPTAPSLSAAGVRRVTVALTGKGPGASSWQHYLKINIVPGTEWQSIYIGNVKLEEGNIATEWSPAPSDPADYITASIRDARKESGSFDGGLILATLMRLGFTGADGAYKVRSGISGIADRAEAPAIWMGGDMVDAENNPLGLDPATAMLRHNGTGYFCGNTIRLRQNRMEVGEGVVLDAEGLSLDVDGSRRLAITTAPVGDFPAADKTYLGLAAENNPNVRFAEGDGTHLPQTNLYLASDIDILLPISDGALISGTQVRVELKFSMSVTVRHPANGTLPPVPQPFTLSMAIERNGAAYQQDYASVRPTLIQSVPGSYSIYSYTRTANFAFIVSEATAGTFATRVHADKDLGLGTSNGGSTTSAAVTRSGNVRWDYADQTIIGRDGLLSVWGRAAMLVKNDMWGALVGDFGLRITPLGFEATTTAGNQWKQLDISKLYKQV